MTNEALPTEVYRKYKDEVLKRCNASQTFKIRGRSDEEIGEELGIPPVWVREIRSIAELEAISLSTWKEADEFKAKRAKEYAATRQR